jgi:hypothetical protein
MINKHNKKGSILDLFIWIVMALVMVVSFGAIIYGFNIMSTTVSGITETINPDSNETIGNLASQTIGKGNEAIGLLRFVALAIFFGLFMSIILTSFLTRAHPAFFIFYVLVLIVLIIISVIIANAYEIIRVDDVLGSTYQSFTALDYFLMYLPYFVAVIGFLAGIILYGININSGTEI